MHARAPALPWALGWFVVAFVAILWSHGLAPTQFLTPDEAVNLTVGKVIATTGHPFVALPFPDPEDLAHPRGWHSVGEVALAIYPPVSLYFYALTAALGSFGVLLLFAFTASGVAAFAAGTARLLPPSRRFLAAFAPALGTPALYWLLRPWMNVAGLLVSLCWSLYFWSRWRESGKSSWLAAALAAVGMGAAVRPDCAAYVLSIALLFAIAAEPRAYRRAIAFTVAAGAAAVGVNLVLNHVVTGHALRAAYQMVLDHGTTRHTDSSPFGLVGTLLFPFGLPTPAQAWTFVSKYWFGVFPLPLLLLCELTLLPLLAALPRRERAITLVALGLALVWMLARMSAEVFGGARPEGFLHDSTPRYWSPIVLFAALPPLLFLGWRARGRTLVLGTAFVAALSLASVVEVAVRSKFSLWQGQAVLAKQAQWLKSYRRALPADAMVYSQTYDKVLWSGFRLGTVEDAEPTAASLSRAAQHGLPVFVLIQGRFEPFHSTLERALAKNELRLVPVEHLRQVYRVDR